MCIMLLERDLNFMEDSDSSLFTKADHRKTTNITTTVTTPPTTTPTTTPTTVNANDVPDGIEKRELTTSSRNNQATLIENEDLVKRRGTVSDLFVALEEENVLMLQQIAAGVKQFDRLVQYFYV